MKLKRTTVIAGATLTMAATALVATPPSMASTLVDAAPA